MLDASSAADELRAFLDPDFSGYLGDAPDKQTMIDRAIDQWAEALYKCARFVTPVSTASLAAKAAFQAAAVGMHLDVTGAVFQAACASFADTLGAGMVGYVATSPPGLFVPVGSGPITVASVACTFMAGQLAAWFATGTAINLSTTLTEPWA